MQRSYVLFIYFLSFLFILNPSCNSQNTPPQINSNSKDKIISKLDSKIWAVFQDRKGNYWFGSNGNGIFYFDGKNLKQFTIKNGLVSNTIRGFQEDHLGNILIETQGGVSIYNGKTFRTLVPNISKLNQWKLEPNDLWFNCNGHPNDIYRYDGDSLFELTLPRKNLNKAFGISDNDMRFSPYSVYGIDKDKDGILWIGTVIAGAFRYDGNSFLWVAEKELTTLPDGRVPGVRSMLEDKNGYMWLSNFINKYKINDSNEAYEKLKGIDQLNKYFPNRIPYFNSGLSDKNGNLWMTTYTGGVWKYDGNELFNFPIYNGKTEALLISIYEDNEGIIWLGTDNDGVYKFNGKRFEKFEPLKSKSSD